MSNGTEPLSPERLAEITPDMSNPGRCISVHWSLPVQCVLPAAHAANWHEASQAGNRIRYRRSMGTYSTEVLRGDTWHDLGIPAPAPTGSAEVERFRAALTQIADMCKCSGQGNCPANIAQQALGEGGAR